MASKKMDFKEFELKEEAVKLAQNSGNTSGTSRNLGLNKAYKLA